ncbi:hypothetical protein PQ455_01770 [Sphingomonas naphthae]|uniref:LytR family transcriptional regulator n=1 Tax=Sphingomonas naphthae TaxID=1813468 RepID=A0ABY7TLW4_9SPHN|nr:hypothetical protein [Sphingomonas naphthae]WCT73988.1 hypothetical protein PQ455_01770 [Sphingomonas naphthae]
MPKVKRERRTPEEAYKFLDAKMRGGTARPGTRGKKISRKTWILIGVGVAALILLGIVGLVVDTILSSTDKSAPVVAGRKPGAIDPTTCLDDKGQLPSMVGEVSRALGIAAQIVPTSTVFGKNQNGRFEVTMTYHPDIDLGTNRDDKALATMDPRYCTVQLITATAR